MNNIVIDIIYISSIFSIFIFSFLICIIKSYKKYKNKKRIQEIREYEKEHSNYYKIMAPNLDIINKPDYECSYYGMPNDYYTYAIGIYNFKNANVYSKHGERLLPSAGCNIVEMSQDEYDEFVIKYKIDPDLIDASIIFAPTSTVEKDIKFIEEIFKMSQKDYIEFINKYHLKSDDIINGYKKLLAKRRG